jgi:hypothetical protein
MMFLSNTFQIVGANHYVKTKVEVENYLHMFVENRGLEPLTPALQRQCSTN